MPASDRNGGIQSVERAIGLLEVLEAHGGEARLTELALASGLSKSTVHNILNTLIGMGYVKQERTRYALDLRLRKLSQPLEATEARLLHAFTPALRAFADLTGENCFLAVPCGTRSYLTLGALNRDGRAMRLPTDARRDGLLTSAVGKVFLAHDARLEKRVYRQTFTAQNPAELWQTVASDLKQVAETGFALDLQASQKGLNCVALPLRMRGKVVASISASGPTDRLNAQRMQRLANSAMREFFDLVKC